VKDQVRIVPMSKRLLIIEDDDKLGAQIVKRLSDAGFAPTWIKEGRLLGVDELASVELVVLDLMLPGTYGMDILKHLRGSSDVPVLVLSARIETSDKVRALALGADDYMTKPFWPEELVERVRARLRRPSLERATSAAVEVGAVTIDRQDRNVWVHGERVELTRVEFDLLAMLAERPGAAVTRRSLAERVLDPGRDGDERTLDVHVSRLRKKLGPESIVETVWGIGYRLATRSSK
jgi:DNA-binding response OmpR family regulator